MAGHLEKLRAEEILGVREFLRDGLKVMELGGGNGYQASIIESWGCKVYSIDLPARQGGVLYHPIIEYDGTRIPFKDSQFDVIFSSNVLEHVKDLPSMFTELRRVLKPKGRMVHILPSSSWRFWTSLAHYVYFAKLALKLPGRLLRRGGAPSSGTVTIESERPVLAGCASRPGMTTLMRLALWPGPHGEYPNAISELYYFSKGRWIREFARNGFEVVGVDENHLFYTGYELKHELTMQRRRTIARYLGSSCHVFVVRDLQPEGS